MNALKTIGISLGVVTVIAGLWLLQLSPWLLALYVLVCLVFGMSIIPSDYK
jgi:ABC-type transport system involved in cytochrome bd biosynthesis fused ATPase/permease subunit